MKADIAEIEKTLASDVSIKRVIIAELKDLMKKYGADRRTEMISADEVVVPEEESFIEDYNVKMFLTRQNYLKKRSRLFPCAPALTRS